MTPKSKVLVAALLLLPLASAQAAKFVKAPQPLPVVEYAEVVEEDLLSVAAPAPRTVAARPAVVAPVAKPQPAVRAVAVKAPARATTPAPVIAATRSKARSMVLKATAYNSIPNQTDSTPTITATGTRTRVGVVAMSRDMLRVFPYGTRVKIEDLSGRYNFSGRVFVVEDTMHPRKTNQVDIWMPTYREAINFGKGTVRVTALK